MIIKRCITTFNYCQRLACTLNKQQTLCSIKKQQVHTSASIAAKLYLDKENTYAHDVLEQSLRTYQIFRVPPVLPTTAKELMPSVLNPISSIDEYTGNEIYERFINVTNHCISTQTKLSNARFNADVEVFCENCHKLNDEQLLNCLHQMSQLPEEDNVRAPNFVELWNTLDVVCCKQLENWNTERILLVCDAWYELKLVRISEFVGEALRKLGRKVRRMPAEHLVQTMFICNLVRRPIYEMHDFELALERCIDELSVQELSIMAMGFFKTQTPIRNPMLVEQLYKRLLAEVNTVQDIALVALLKILRYSSKLPQIPLMFQLLDALNAEVPRFSLLSCLHIALLGSDLQCCHDEIVEHILQRFEVEIEQTRLKDLERICLIIGLFNINTATKIENRLCTKILQSLQSRLDEIMLHPRCFPTCLHYLAIKGFYDMEMISAVLDIKFLRHAYGKNLPLGREIFGLDSFIKINLKDAGYIGNQLPDKYRNTMGKFLTHYIPERNPKFKLHTTDRILMEIKETSQILFRDSTFKHILPHFERPDVIICYDRSKRKSIPLSAECAKDYSGVILTREQFLGDHSEENIYTLAVVVAGWNNVVREKDRFTGLFASKLNQLQLLGHKPIVIHWYEWRDLETQADRLNYLKRQLAKVIPL